MRAGAQPQRMDRWADRGGAQGIRGSTHTHTFIHMCLAHAQPHQIVLVHQALAGSRSHQHLRGREEGPGGTREAHASDSYTGF
jgi:hypothetical protein